MIHRDAFGRALHIGQLVTFPTGHGFGHVAALGRRTSGESMALVTASRDDSPVTCLAADLVGVRAVPR